jgi:hypothetical protein
MAPSGRESAYDGEAIKAKAFILVDEEGKERAFLRVDKDGAGLTLHDENGKPRAALGVDKHDGSCQTV